MPQLEHHEYDLFFSYSHRDREIVSALAAALREEGFSVFLDVWNMPEKADDLWDWTEIVDAALSRSKAGVIFFSPSSLKSKWVRTEAIRLTNKSALKQSFVVLPIRLRPCEIHPYLKDHRSFDLFDHSPGAAATAADKILHALALESQD